MILVGFFQLRIACESVFLKITSFYEVFLSL